MASCAEGEESGADTHACVCLRPAGPQSTGAMGEAEPRHLDALWSRGHETQPEQSTCARQQVVGATATGVARVHQTFCITTRGVTQPHTSLRPHPSVRTHFRPASLDEHKCDQRCTHKEHHMPTRSQELSLGHNCRPHRYTTLHGCGRLAHDARVRRGGRAGPRRPRNIKGGCVLLT